MMIFLKNVGGNICHYIMIEKTIAIDAIIISIN